MIDEHLAFRITIWQIVYLAWTRIEKNSSLAQWIVWVAQLVRAPARRAGDPGLNPGPGENFSLKLLIRWLFINTHFNTVGKFYLKLILILPSSNPIKSCKTVFFLRNDGET